MSDESRRMLQRRFEVAGGIGVALLAQREDAQIVEAPARARTQAGVFRTVGHRDDLLEVVLGGMSCSW